MKMSNSLTFVFVLLATCNEAFAGIHLGSPLLDEHRFVLRSCVATAELIKKLRNDGNTRPSVPESSEILRRSATTEPQDKGIDTSGDPKNVNHRRTHENTERRHLTVNNSRDSPLKTIEIRTINKRRPIFRKKNQLPVLEDQVSSSNSEMSNNIILIKSLP